MDITPANLPGFLAACSRAISGGPWKKPQIENVLTLFFHDNVSPAPRNRTTFPSFVLLDPQALCRAPATGHRKRYSHFL